MAPAAATGQAVPQVLARRDPEARIVIVMERAAPHQRVRPDPLQLDPVAPAKVLDLHLILDPPQFLVADPTHRLDLQKAKTLVFQGKKLSRC